MPDVQVLISGSGPTGLMMALWLDHFKVPFRIIDKATGPGQTSRATVVHARTIEFYRQLGLGDRIVSAGLKAEGMTMARQGKIRGQVSLRDAGKGLSRYPFALVLPQDVHEALVNEVLAERGVQIERGVELAGAVETDDGVHVTLRKVAGEDIGKEETVKVSYLVGADGAKSAVRHIAGVRMEGGTYSQLFYVADVDIDPRTPPVAGQNLTMNLTTNEFCMVLPFKKENNCRLVGFVPKDKASKENVSFEDVAENVKAATKMNVANVGWFNTYHVHHRHADHFRYGRSFLCGDACHLHSPAGGQGLNSGLGDATNLAWKLAAVINGSAPESLLDTYETERLAFAKTLVQTTDSVFQLLTNEGWTGWFFRDVFMSYIWPWATMFSFIRTRGWKTISQILIHYPQSQLSVNAPGLTGSVKAGDRIPFLEADDNHSYLQDCKWQAHVYGAVDGKTQELLNDQGLKLYTFPWSAEAQAVGMGKDVVYLIRPDGHVGWAGPQSANNKPLEEYIKLWGISKSL
jgi:2-polyprenyl-6-methoxyphenol hydroxylase-like FAD-dependent oxidoreductase